MKKEKEVRRTRDHYVLTFNDGDTDQWKIGNLSKFLRHLYNDNQILRELNPKIKSAREFSTLMTSRLGGRLVYALEKRGSLKASLYQCTRNPFT